jgi:hypothetical protein
VELHKLPWARLRNELKYLQIAEGGPAPQSGAFCVGATCPPSDHAWELPSDNTILEVAEVSNIPPELLGAVLQIVQEYDYSKTDLFEDCIFGSLAYASHPAFAHPPLNLPAKILLQEGLLGASLLGRIPSPGLTQLQIGRAKQMEEWLFIQNAANPEYEPMRRLLGTSENTGDRLVRLYEPESAVAYAAVHLRWLIEQEYGPLIAPNTLTVDEMTPIVAQFNIGPRSEQPRSDYSGYLFYELAPEFLRMWQTRLRTR